MKKILCIVQLPPPVHGVTLTNDTIKNSEHFNSKFNTKYINYSFVKEIDKIGGFSIKKSLYYIKRLFAILYSLIKFKPDAVYFTIAPVGGAFIRDAITVLLLKLFNSKKIVLHLHGKGIHEEMKGSKRLRYMYSLVFSNTEVILLSKLLKDDLKLIKSAYNVYYLPNGIRSIPHSVREKNKAKPFKLIYLSNLIQSKGVLVLLEALQRLTVRGYDNFIINFVGKTSKSITEVSLNEEVKRLKLQKHVHYLGPKYDKEKAEILDSSTIFVFPTLKDCFPLVLLEAMQSKLAIISTNEGAIPEIIENNVNGIICEKGDIHGLSDAIIKLFDMPEMIDEYGEKAYKKYRESYTSEIFEKRLVECFNKIFENNEYRRQSI